MKKKLLFGLLIVILAILPVLTGCGSKATPAKIIIALSGTITTLDPTVMGGGGNQAGYNVFETLVDFDTDNNIIPQLAESWSFSADSKELSIKLKSGIKFSTGDPLTTADVKFSLDRYASNPGPVAAQLTQNFSGMQIIDDLNFKFLFPEINVQFLPQTVSGMNILSKTQYDRLGEDEWVKQVAGTGPYKFVSYKEGQYADLAYNELYRGEKPQITDARFIYTPDGATRVSQLQAGEVDMIWDVPGTSVAQLTQAGFNRYDIVQPHDIVINFDLLKPGAPWNKLEVRQAINYAIDKDSLNKSLFAGVFQKGVWLVPWELGYDSSLQPAYPYDLNKAKQLMSQAGYPDGFEMPITYVSFFSWSKDMIDYLTGALAQIGITVKPDPISDFGQFMGNINTLHADNTKTGVLVYDVGWPANPESVINLTNGFYSIKDNTLFKDTEIDALIKQALETQDRTKRGEIVKQAYQKIDALLPFIPIFLEVTVAATKSNITYTPSTGYGSGPFDLVDLTVK